MLYLAHLLVVLNTLVGLDIVPQFITFCIVLVCLGLIVYLFNVIYCDRLQMLASTGVLF